MAAEFDICAHQSVFLHVRRIIVARVALTAPHSRASDLISSRLWAIARRSLVLSPKLPLTCDFKDKAAHACALWTNVPLTYVPYFTEIPLVGPACERDGLPGKISNA